jgi:hypothetical protein
MNFSGWWDNQRVKRVYREVTFSRKQSLEIYRSGAALGSDRLCYKVFAQADYGWSVPRAAHWLPGKSRNENILFAFTGEAGPQNFFGYGCVSRVGPF